MPPNPWLAFTFFGIPLVIGLIAGVHGSRLAWGAYRRHARRGIPDPPGQSRSDPRYTLREQVVRAAGLLVVAALLIGHSGRWLLSIYGYL